MHRIKPIIKERIVVIQDKVKIKAAMKRYKRIRISQICKWHLINLSKASRLTICFKKILIMMGTLQTDY